MPSPARTARIYTVVAWIEAASWVALLIGMFLKHITRTTDVGVQIFGMAHGIIVLVYVAAAVLAWRVLRWGWTEAAVALIAAVPPLATIPAERWLRRRGCLEDPASRSSAANRAGATSEVSPSGDNSQSGRR